MTTITPQIRGNEADAITRMHFCKTNMELKKVLMGFVSKNIKDAFVNQEDFINVTPRSCRFDVYEYLMDNSKTQFVLQLTPRYISENLNIPEDIVEESLQMLIKSHHIIDQNYDNVKYYTIF